MYHGQWKIKKSIELLGMGKMLMYSEWYKQIGFPGWREVVSGFDEHQLILGSKPGWECWILGWSEYNLHVEGMWMIGRRKNRKDSKNDCNFPLPSSDRVSFVIPTLAMWLALASGKLAILKHASTWRASIFASFGTLCHVNETRLDGWMREGTWPSGPCYPAVIQLTSWNRSVELTRSWPQMNERGQLRPAENYLTESNPNSQNQAEFKKWLLTSRN